MIGSKDGADKEGRKPPQGENIMFVKDYIILSLTIILYIIFSILSMRFSKIFKFLFGSNSRLRSYPIEV